MEPGELIERLREGYGNSLGSHQERDFLWQAADALEAALLRISEQHQMLSEQTLLVDRLCTAVDEAAEDIGHESIDDLLALIGPCNERCIKMLGDRAVLSPLGG